MQGPQILVGAFGARQEWGGRKWAEEFSGGVGVDRPSVRTDERCYTDEGVGDGVRRGEVGGDWRAMGKVKMAACFDGNHRSVRDHKV